MPVIEYFASQGKVAEVGPNFASFPPSVRGLVSINYTLSQIDSSRTIQEIHREASKRVSEVLGVPDS